MDAQPENELLEAVLDRARNLGITIERIAPEPERGGHRIDALVRIGSGRDART